MKILRQLLGWVAFMIALQVSLTNLPPCFQARTMTPECRKEIFESPPCTQYDECIDACDFASLSLQLELTERFCIAGELGFKHFVLLGKKQKWRQAFEFDYKLFQANPYSHQSWLTSSLELLREPIMNYFRSVTASTDDLEFAIVLFYSSSFRQGLKTIERYKEKSIQKLRLLVRFHQALGDPFEAYNQIQKFKEHQNHYTILFQTGSLLMHKVEYSWAINSFNGCLKQLSSDQSSLQFRSCVHLYISMCEARLGRQNDAFKRLDTLKKANQAPKIQQSVQFWSAYTTYAQNAMESSKEQLDSIQTIHRQLVAAHPTSIIAHVNLAHYLLEYKQNYEEALKVIDTARQISPESSHSFIMKARITNTLRKSDSKMAQEAEITFKQLIDVAYTRTNIKFGELLAAIYPEGCEEAIETLLMALEADPSAETRLWLGACYGVVQKYKLCVQLIDSAKKEGSSNNVVSQQRQICVKALNETTEL